LSPGAFAPAELIRRNEPFDDPAFLYELKYGGFLANNPLQDHLPARQRHPGDRGRRALKQSNA
jgi:hypothetical protein